MVVTIHHRTARPTDLPALLELEAQFPGDRLSRRQLRFHLAQSDQRLRVALDAARLVGYSLVLLPARQRSARLYSLVVDTSMRGQGVGKALLADAECAANQRGANALRLEVRADNVTAISLYQRAGYAVIGTYEHYYDDGVDAIRLHKPLTQRP